MTFWLWLLAASASPELDRTTQEVLAADRARTQALLVNDVEGLDRLTGDGYIHVDSNGRVRNREQFMADRRRGGGRFAIFAIDESKVDVYGDTAVVSGRYHNSFAGPNSRTKYARFLRVYVRQGDRWVNVAHQATEIAAPPAAD